MPKINFKRAIDYALERLETGLFAKLYYHSLVHTRDDVVPAVERLATAEHIHGDLLTLLMTAAYYHDIGFTELTGIVQEDDAKRAEHERLGVLITQETLPRFGYSSAQIDVISGIIMATRLPQTPKNLVEQIMADADLDSLGRQDFWVASFALRHEFEAFGARHTDQSWYQLQYNFLTRHTYFTQSAKELRDAQKQRNIEDIMARLQHVEGEKA